MKKLIALLLTVVLTASVAIGGTVAYLQDSARNDNTMTVGKVDISQWEYQRVQNADGTYPTDTIDGKTSYKLESFEQDKMLLPATEIDANGNPYNYGAGTWDTTTVRMTQVGSYGGMQVFESPNAVDKFVVVKNEGNTDAYVRTIVAIECGNADKAALIGSSYHSNWKKNDAFTATIDGKIYWVTEYIYQGASDGSRHVGGKLPTGEMTYPSFCQVYLKSAATNEDLTAIDANSNGKLDILVLSQAVQADGWEAASGKTVAQTALDTAFGKVDATNVATWFAANP